ncbi:DUF4442 domain-containing protein [Arcticibacter svalbardensis]|nr:DUF4442 domain-containing protein [Arcticibacter svalbardensis]
MLISENTLKWVMRFYPPLLFQRIWVRHFDTDFLGVDVKIFKSLFNLNYNRSIFGGTIYAAADPFYAVLYYQAMRRKGYKVIVWQKAAEIFYLKPGMSNLYFNITITKEEINTLSETLDETGKAEQYCTLEIKDVRGEICARVISLVYIRKLD